MGFFRRLRGSGQATPARPDVARDEDYQPRWQPGTHVQVALYEGQEDLEVVGESHYQGALWQLVGAVPPDERVREDVYAVLVAEADNEHDPNAVSVWVEGLKVGYLSREDAKRYRPGLLALEAKEGKPTALKGVIAGGGMREDGLGRLGVFLRHDPTDFGLPAPTPPPREGLLRTGSGVALTDESGDVLGTSWRLHIPEDSIAAITALRGFLKEETDSINRHFMFCDLEAALYRSRDAFTSALDDFDETCRQHDAEMEGIREAFIAKWGDVPLPETYRQMCIRQQKAKNFEQALWWAERGIAVYGDDAARPEDVEDLKKRAETYRAKLGR